MAATREMSSAFVRARWSNYLQRLMREHKVTKTTIARTIEYQESRVNAWINGERGVSSDIAFETGERLRDQLQLPTSGIEALFACGSLLEVLQLFNHLGSNYAQEGNTIAVALYCWLPAEMLRYEHAWWDAQFQAAVEISPNIVGGAIKRYGRDWFFVEMAVDLAHRFPRTVPADLSDLVRAADTRRLVAQAWADSNQGQLRLSVKREEGTTMCSLTGSAIHYTRTYGQLWPDHANELMEWVIDLSERFRLMVPSIVAPRLWRLVAEWAYSRDSATYEKYRAVLPHPYRTFEDPQLSEDEIDYMRWLEHESERQRGK